MRLETPAGQPSRYRVDRAGRRAGRADRHRHRRRRVLARRPRLRSRARGDRRPVSGARPDLSRSGSTTPISMPSASTSIWCGRSPAPLIVEIDDGDSPPLARPRVTLSGVERRALVPPSRRGPTLYYGNAATRRPVYDLEALRAAARRSPRAIRKARSAPRPSTRASRALPPMAFLAARGAAADTAQWAAARTLRIAGGDDVYTLTLAPRRPRLPAARPRRRAPCRRRAPAGALRARAARRRRAGRAGHRRGDAARPTRRRRRPGSSRCRPTAPARSRTAPPLAALDLLFTRRLLHAAGGAAGAGSRAPRTASGSCSEATLRATRRDARRPPDAAVVRARRSARTRRWAWKSATATTRR